MQGRNWTARACTTTDPLAMRGAAAPWWWRTGVAACILLAPVPAVRRWTPANCLEVKALRWVDRPHAKAFFPHCQQGRRAACPEKVHCMHAISCDFLTSSSRYCDGPRRLGCTPTFACNSSLGASSSCRLPWAPKRKGSRRDLWKSSLPSGLAPSKAGAALAAAAAAAAQHWRGQRRASQSPYLLVRCVFWIPMHFVSFIRHLAVQLIQVSVTGLGLLLACPLHAGAAVCRASHFGGAEW